jgi:delta 1-pyrroline-5-carboxylate dehydrogenase
LTLGTSLFLTGVKGGKDAYEMLPITQITSVANRKDGLLYHLVEVQTAGGTVGFRVSRDDAAAFRQAILNLMQVRAATPLTVQVANTAPDSSPTTTTNDHVTQLQQLAQLRDAGILTDEEFASKKQEILSRI